MLYANNSMLKMGDGPTPDRPINASRPPKNNTKHGITIGVHLSQYFSENNQVASKSGRFPVSSRQIYRRTAPSTNTRRQRPKRLNQHKMD